MISQFVADVFVNGDKDEVLPCLITALIENLSRMSSIALLMLTFLSQQLREETGVVEHSFILDLFSYQPHLGLLPIWTAAW